MDAKALTDEEEKKNNYNNHCVSTYVVTDVLLCIPILFLLFNDKED